jgi:hypothetical protein
MEFVLTLGASLILVVGAACWALGGRPPRRGS